MGLFDRIKRAFTGEEAEKSEESVVEEVGSESESEPETEPVATELASETATEESATSALDALDSVTDEALAASVVEPEEAEPTVAAVEVAETKVPVAEATVAAVVPETTLETPAEESVEPEVESLVAETPAVQVPETVQKKYDKGLEKTRKTFGQRLNALFANFRTVDEDFFEELEETLIGADVGYEVALKISEELRQEVKLRNAKKPAVLQNTIIEKLVDLYEAEGVEENSAINMQKNGVTVMLFVGVNGVGKTTSIGKLAHQYRNEGKKVLMAAADTFRAGAINQLVVWGERAGVEVVRGKEQGDPAAVVYDAVAKAKAENYDVLLVDTAGRLQNKVNLMKELEKIKRVIQRELPDAPHEVLLAVDATTGQNALVQAKQFKETTDVTGLILTKLDGTAKGGIVLAIRNELHLPVKLVGLGEGIDDLEVFDANEFAEGLFKGLLKVED
jgi:fused signal recognition particle receptor